MPWPFSSARAWIKERYKAKKQKQKKSTPRNIRQLRIAFKSVHALRAILSLSIRRLQLGETEIRYYDLKITLFA
jgi:hypothetical protein